MICAGHPAAQLSTDASTSEMQARKAEQGKPTFVHTVCRVGGNGTDTLVQIDSHMDFVKNFDSELVAMHHRTNNEYAILSTYVSPIEETDGALDKKEVPLLCMVTFTATIRNWGTKACR